MARFWPSPPDDPAVRRLVDEGSSRTIVIGTLVLAAGAIATVVLWNAGWIWGASIFLFVTGAGLLVSGLAASSREARGRREGARLQRDYLRLLDGLYRSEPGRAQRLRWLRAHDVTHRKLAQHLLDLVASVDPARRTGGRPGGTVIPSLAQGRDTSFPPIRDLVGTAHPLEEGDLARFEARHSLRLPVPYQRFLLRHNGGVLKPDWFAYGCGGSHVRAFCPLGTGEPGDLDAMFEAASHAAGRDGPRLLPIAVTTDDGIIALVVDEQDHGAVYLRPKGAADATPIADDLFAFLRSITWKPGTEPPPPPKRRSRR